jgi:hypothetical protein
MKMSDVFTSKYMKASDLNGSEQVMKIAGCYMEEVGADKDEKPVLYFENQQKGLVLNRTNSDRLVHRYGDDTAKWEGGHVRVYSELVSYQGKQIEGIRLQPTKAPAPSDEIPF